MTDAGGTETPASGGRDTPAWGLAAILFVVAAGHLSLFPRIADLDSFYHVGHAAAYLEGSLLDPSLPWATRSVIGDLGADLWWGFHVLLGPLTIFDDPAVGIRVGAVLLTLTLALTAWWVLDRHGIPYAAWWAAALLVAVPNVFFRFVMLRPHVLTLAASLALLSVLVRGRWWQVLLLGAFVSWVHLSLFWIAPGLVVAYAVTRIPVGIAAGPAPNDRGVPMGVALAAALAGATLGWLARPAPLATASLLNVQLVLLLTEQAADQPMLFAAEILPMGAGELVRSTWSFLLVWLAALATLAVALKRGILSRLGEERTTFVLACALVSMAFLGLALVSARRAIVQWTVFGFVLVPFAWTALSEPEWRRRLRPVWVALLVAHGAWGAWRHGLNVEHAAFPGDTLAEAAVWLADSSEPGDVVFHARWDNFGPLFAHNRTNRYLGGMDPIFQYTHDAAAFWEFFHLSADVTQEWTCDAFPCARGTQTDTHRALRDHFGARWVLVEPRRNPRLTLYLLNDARYRLALETQREAVFEVLP